MRETIKPLALGEKKNSFANLPGHRALASCLDLISENILRKLSIVNEERHRSRRWPSKDQVPIPPYHLRIPPHPIHCELKKLWD